jgi:hypothetical protein
MGLTVVKVGGAALAQAPFRLADHVETGEEVVVVHGAGGRIDAALRRAGIASTFVGGRRVTPPEAMRHVKAAFTEENRGLCRQIGPAAVGLLGDELGLEAEPLPELRSVGIPLAFAPPRLRQLLREARVPVVARCTPTGSPSSRTSTVSGSPARWPRRSPRATWPRRSTAAISPAASSPSSRPRSPRRATASRPGSARPTCSRDEQESFPF